MYQINSMVRTSVMIVMMMTVLLLSVTHVSSQRITLSIDTQGALPLVFTGYYTPDVSKNNWNWNAMDLQASNPYKASLSIPVRMVDPIVYRAHISGNTNFVTNYYPFASLSVSVEPSASNGTFVFSGSAQCGDNVTGGGAVSGTLINRYTIGNDNRCWTYMCHCGPCRGTVTAIMAVCYEPPFPKPSPWLKIKNY
ncbi:hypothetical protein C9374_006428 [Naegleria lovaniensis]|uniref:Uncharacterized protein n=1 Tax=Naegleria lovaniensis TaxID=51637 RepID=A0AA88KH67_NAELO|nr:uncharacterized protein C9374_006428 [Naegleria lovaniensis]KAG2381439.1 hypothetical protein C9374_006428 [Naegleria lovaniensis]